MNSTFNIKPKHLLLILSVLLCIGCKQHSVSVFSGEERHKADSILDAIDDTTKLKQLADKYEKEKNILYQEVALRKLGKVCRDLNFFTQAINYHTKGLNIATEACDTPEIIHAFNSIGTNYRRMGIYDEASHYHLQALTYTMKYSDKTSYAARKSRVVSLNGVGNVFLSLGNIESADSVFRLALRGEEEIGSELGMAINFANIGSIMEKEGRIDSAWVYYRKSLAENEKIHSKVGVSLCHTYFGALYEKQNQPEKAIAEYQESYRIMENDPDRWHWLEPCVSLARIYIKMNNLPMAHSYLEKAKNVTEQINSDEHRVTVHNLYYQYYEKQGNYPKALENYVASRELNDSMTSEANMNRIQNMRVNMERTRYLAEVKLVSDRYEAERNAKFAVIVGSLVAGLLLLAVIGLMLYLLRVRKQKEEMSRQMNETRERFFTNITHEFRTPLTVILGESETLLAEDSIDPAERRKAGEMIARQGNNLLDLVNQLLDIGKIKSAVGEPEWHTGNVVPYIHMIVESLESLAKDKNIDLQFISKSVDVTMDMVPDYILKVVRNLVNNSIKFTPVNGFIKVICEQKNDKFEIKVSDNGMGMSADVVKHVFQPFYQASGEAQYVGTGVGLSLVKQIVEVMGGTIDVMSEPGVGSTFTISLPMHHGKGNWTPFQWVDLPKEGDKAVVIKENTLLPEQGTNAQSDDLVLVVEDNPDVAQYIGSRLISSFKVAYAENGQVGLEKARYLNPQIILSDIMMPVMNGLEMVRQLRNNQQTNTIPVIMITAKTTQEDLEEGLRAGANTYLTKPFRSSELLLRINHILAERTMLRDKFALVEKEVNEVGDEGKVLSEEDKDFVTAFTNVVYDQMKLCDINIKQTAERMFTSERQLRRRITDITGMNPSSYIFKIKIDYACHLLKNDSKCSIKDVALQCGFSDLSQFSRGFKKYMGCTPMQYRKINGVAQNDDEE